MSEMRGDDVRERSPLHEVGDNNIGFGSCDGGQAERDKFRVRVKRSAGTGGKKGPLVRFCLFS